jgi:hypothetical protein
MSVAEDDVAVPAPPVAPSFLIALGGAIITGISAALGSAG